MQDKINQKVETDNDETDCQVKASLSGHLISKDETEKLEFLEELRHNTENQQTNSKSTLTAEEVKAINETAQKELKLDSPKRVVLFIGVLCQLGGRKVVTANYRTRTLTQQLNRSM
jgi:hypothetical protein